MLRRCYKCKEVKDINLFAVDKQKKYGRSYICKYCKYKVNTEYQKRYRLEHKKRISKQVYAWAQRNKVKRNIYQTIYRGIKKGTLKRKPCIICGTVKSEAHHEDYSKPLDVVWYCHIHHLNLHRQLRQSN